MLLFHFMCGLLLSLKSQVLNTFKTSICFYVQKQWLFLSNILLSEVILGIVTNMYPLFGALDLKTLTGRLKIDCFSKLYL